ncbi:lysylphosphatidylglycerol synthase transmembrane domain-containing protein [Paraflavitalea sp. CAU 1676]|uniref:lysylphosphatidylglycerol synthase transmembrane domain-containing protein n=1 Tax=Paraflavitalea sp. CAU 1676 TaxID=3032598 RepID=UPI0023DC60F2|nr:lysylphosphatidylglycerol synthase transmembrane domain-containing protein [Paraflavitalea sp. CAU 1676]MDF2187361.1 lysylphosphatidylglycerol synthase transmembrane domain-containing protein [Paraflavitalea sp. CAU 1676]
MIGPLVFCLLAWSIYHQLQRQPNWKESFSHIQQALAGAGIWKLWSAVLLMLVNWGIEARKWQVVIRRIEPISFGQSLKAIFTGTTMAFFTPNRIGEYVGRILYIGERNRIQGISLTIVCSIAQLLVTLIAGIGALFYMKSIIAVQQPGDTSLVFWINTLLSVTAGGAVILTLFYFRLSWLVKWIEKIPRIERFVRYIRVLDSFNATILLRILSLSVARYLVFIGQYYLLFAVFDVSLTPAQVFASIGVVFLVLAVVPTIAVITELGVRWKASIELVQFFSTNTWGVLATSLSVWIINLVIPALIGSLLILGIRIFKNR